MAEPAATRPNGAPARVALEQRSSYLDYLPRALLNAALVIVTFNVYLFWAKTDIRRYLWSTTYLGGSPLAYTGNARELAWGFVRSTLLLTVVLGLPVMVLITALADDIGPSAGAGLDVGTGNALVDLVLLMVIPVSWSTLALLVELAPDVPVPAPVTAMSVAVLAAGWFYGLAVSRHLVFGYLMRHTRWNGARGDVAGTPWRYGARLLFPDLSRWLTLGWTGPWRYVLRWRCLFDGGVFGAARVRFDGRASALYPRFAATWSILVALAVAVNAVVGSVAGEDDSILPWVVAAAAAAACAVVVGVVAWYNERVYRHVAESLTVGDMRFRFTASWRELALLYLINLAMNAVSAGLTYYYTRMRIARFVVRHLVIDGDPRCITDGAHDPADRRAGRLGEGMEALVAASYL